MFRNYLKTALRNLLRNKSVTFINVLSLVIGVVGCLCIGLFVLDELKYDKFIPGGDRVYRLYNKVTTEQEVFQRAPVPPMLTQAAEDFPEVEETLRIYFYNAKLLTEFGNVKAYEDKGLFVEGTFFELFPLELSHGQHKNALTEPNTVVISPEMADKYFRGKDPLGNTLVIDKENYKVTGVLKGIPEHFHIDFKFLLSFATLEIPEERMKSWGWSQFFAYLKLKEGTNLASFTKKYQDNILKTANAAVTSSEVDYVPMLQPLSSIHLRSANFRMDEIVKKGNETYTQGLSIIAVFVLVIACFNFINLSTARSIRRAKEIGVRKVLGAEQKQLLIQFIFESVLLALIAFIIGALCTKLLLKPLNDFTNKSIDFSPFTNPLQSVVIIGSGILLGILAGIYPALVLTRFIPVKVLKGSGAKTGKGSSWLREGLVVVQFALSALLIVSTMIVYRQVNFLHAKDLGFTKEQVLFFELRGDLDQKVDAIKTELLKHPDVISATAGYGLPGDKFAGDGIALPGEGNNEYSAKHFMVDHDYVKTLGLKIIAGRDFSKEMSTDIDHAYILNESGVRELGFKTPQNALGKELLWKTWASNGDSVKRGKVIGVVKDFHYSSLHEKVTTAVLQIYPAYSTIAVKIRPDDMSASIARIQETWNSFTNDYPFIYNFLDESYHKMYVSEDKLNTLLLIFTIMAIVIGCLGLFGLVTFTAEQRTKEIGIRKVLGATVLQIGLMLSKSFMKLIVLASLVAFPIAFWAMKNWIQEFPYRIEISGWIFAAATLAAVMIALLTISYKAIKAALVNPVKSLRSE